MSKYKVKSVKYNFIMNFILTVSNFLFPLVTFPYVSRVLQVEGNGKVAFVTSIVSYFMMVASLGIPTYGIRAAARVRDDKQKLSKVVQEILIINIILVGFVLIIYFGMIFGVDNLTEYRELFYVNAVGIVLNVIGVNWFFQAIEQYDYITIRSIVVRLISLVLIFILVHNPSDYIIYGSILVLSSVGANILNFKRLMKYISFKKTGEYEFLPHIRPILVLFAQNLIVSIYTNLDIVMLGIMKGNYEVGLYSAAVKIKGILLSVVTSLGNVLLPRMSYYVKNSMREKFLEMMTKALNFTFFMSMPLMIFFILTAKESILVLAGEGYLGAILSVQFLVFAVMPNALTGVLGVQVLTPLEKEKFVLYSVLIAAIFDFALNFVLIPMHGASGAAFSTMLAEFLVLAVQICYTKELLMEVRKNVVVLRYFIASIIGIIAVVILKNFEMNIFILIVLQGIVFFGSYVLSLYFLKEPLIFETTHQIIKKIKK